jgi:hypothetical protein
MIENMLDTTVRIEVKSTKQITEFTKSGKNNTILEPAVLSCSSIPYYEYKQYQNPRDARFGGLIHNTSKAIQELL